MSHSYFTTIHSLCIAALILPAFAIPAPDMRGPSELPHAIAGEDSPNIIQQRTPQRPRQRKPPQGQAQVQGQFQGQVQGQGPVAYPPAAVPVLPFNDFNNDGTAGTATVYTIYVTTELASSPTVPPLWPDVPLVPDLPGLSNAIPPNYNNNNNNNRPKQQPRPTQPIFSWPNNANAIKPHPTNTNAPELTWNHEKGILELESPKTVPPAGYAPAQNPVQTIAPAAYYPPPPPAAAPVAQPKTPTGWDVPLVTGGAGMAGMNHDMPKPALVAPANPQLAPAQQPKTPTGWDVPLVTTGAGMAGLMAGMDHNNAPVPTPMPGPPPAPEPLAEPVPQFLVPVSNNIASTFVTVTREPQPGLPLNLGTLVPQEPRAKKEGGSVVAADDDWKL